MTRRMRVEAGRRTVSHGPPAFRVTFDDLRLAVPVVIEAAEPGAVFAGGVAHGRYGVLGERARLHDHRTVLLRVEVDQLDHGGRWIDAGYQAATEGGQPRRRRTAS